MSEEERTPIVPEPDEVPSPMPEPALAVNADDAPLMVEASVPPVEDDLLISATDVTDQPVAASEFETAAASDSQRVSASPVSVAGPAVGNEGDDKLLAALTWLTMVVFQAPILSVALLFLEPNRRRPFQRYHAVASIAFWCIAILYEAIAGAVVGMLTLVTLGIFAICMACLWVIFFVPHVIALIYAFQALTGKTPEIPVITKLAREQGWV